MIKAIGSKKNLEENLYYKYIQDLIQNKDVLRLNEYTHHKYTTRLQHSINVSYYNYLVCHFLGFDEKAGARAGLLHDLFYYNRKEYIRCAGEKFHNARHPRIALENACERFEMSPMEKDIIVKHMFPLTLSLPKYKETVVIIFVDKYCAMAEYLGYKVSRFKEFATNMMI